MACYECNHACKQCTLADCPVEVQNSLLLGTRDSNLMMKVFLFSRRLFNLTKYGIICLVSMATCARLIFCWLFSLSSNK